MVCENAGRWARIHDIYIFAILKSFLGNRIEYEIIIPVPRAVFPARLPFRRCLPLPPRRADGAGRSHPRSSSRSCSRSLYPFRAVSRAVPLAVVPSRHLIRSSHPIIYLVVRSLSLVPFLSPLYRQAGRGVMSPDVSSYCRRMSVISSCEMSWDVVRCKGRGYHRISQNVMFGKQ